VSLKNPSNPSLRVGQVLKRLPLEEKYDKTTHTSISAKIEMWPAHQRGKSQLWVGK
jgi:hypothetical protein